MTEQIYLSQISDDGEEEPLCGEDCECCYYSISPPSAAELARRAERQSEIERQHDEDNEWFAE